MLLAYGGTRNDIMPIFFGLCGVWLILRGLNEDRKQPRCFSALVFFGGMCLALATGAKITAAFIPLGAMLYLFFRDRSKLVSFILGGAVGSLPIAYYTLIAFDKFLYGNIIFHVVERTRFYIDIGQAEILSLPYRVKSLLLTWLEEPSLVLATLFVSFVAFIGWRRGLPFQRIAGGLRHSDKLFIILLVPLAIPFVFLPSPFGAPYLQPAVPYVLLSSAALYPLAQGILEPQQMLTFVAMALVALALQTGRFLVQAAHHLNPSLWAVTQVHDLSLLIAHYVKGGTVATVYPALVLDAGTTVYSEFSTGIYFFRIGDHLASDRVLDLNGISPKTLPIVLAAKPPAAIFAGNTADDQPLLRWAWRNCYVEVDVSRWNGFYDEKWKPRLFLRPDQQGPCVNGGASAAH